MEKIKLILCFLLVLALSTPVKSFTLLKDGKGEPKIEYSNGGSSRQRSPLNFDASVEEVNGVLQIIFMGSISNADIVITDSDGSMVYEELQGSIYDGKTIYINPAVGYPYDIEITTPSIDIIGVIYLE